MNLYRAALTFVAALLLTYSGTASATSNETLLKVLPYCNVMLEPLGDTLTDVAIATPHPVVKGVGYTFKATKLGLELGEAAVDAHAVYLETELVLVDLQAERLHQIHESGGDLNGPEATQIKEQLRRKQFALGNQRDDAFTYTMDALALHWGYAISKTAGKKMFEKTAGALLKNLGLSRLVDRVLGRPPKQANRWFNYGGPLEQLQRDAGWGKLGSRARLAEKAAAKAIQEQQEKLVVDSLKLGRRNAFDKLAETALGRLYAEALARNPSTSHAVQIAPADFRVVAARAAEAAYVYALQPASPAPAPASTPVAAVPLAPARADGLAVAIANDNAIIDWYEDPTPRYERSANVPAPEPEPEPEPYVPQVSESTLRFREALKLVGDGKTFTVCSDGCPSTSDGSWDGEKGKGLDDR